LIDENLSPTLADLARERGYEAMAVRDLGLLNIKDWTLAGEVGHIRSFSSRACSRNNCWSLSALRADQH
jgi:hypothetical protein